MNNPTTLTYTHTFSDKNEIVARKPSTIYCLPDGCASYLDVPIGSRFELITMPETDKQAWIVTTLEVTWTMVDKVDKEKCRYYRHVANEALTPDDIVICRGFVEDMA